MYFFTVNHDFIWEGNNVIKRCVNKLQLNEQNKWCSKDEHVFFSLVIKLAHVQNIILSKPIFFSKKKKKKKIKPIFKFWKTTQFGSIATQCNKYVPMLWTPHSATNESTIPSLQDCQTTDVLVHGLRRSQPR